MRLAGINDLEVAGGLGNLPKAIEIGQDQVGALVSRCAARKTDREGIGIKLKAGLLANRLEQIVLGDQMRGPDFLRRQAQRAPQTVVVLAPRWNVAVKELLKRRRSPRAGVNTVGDGLDRYFRKHLARSFAVLFGDAVDVSAQAQRELRHVDGGAAARGFLQARKLLFRL